MPKTPLRTTIGRTYEWYETMGEFKGIYENLEEDGTCKYCKRTRYCTWPLSTGTDPAVVKDTSL
jgi:hypothetical protein